MCACVCFEGVSQREIQWECVQITTQRQHIVRACAFMYEHVRVCVCECVRVARGCVCTRACACEWKACGSEDSRRGTQRVCTHIQSDVCARVSACCECVHVCVCASVRASTQRSTHPCPSCVCVAMQLSQIIIVLVAICKSTNKTQACIHASTHELRPRQPA